MTIATLERRLRPDDRILLDSTVLIAHLDGTERVSALATHVVDGCVRTGRNQAIMSAVSVMEVLVGPLRLGPLAAGQHARDFLQMTPNLSCANVDFHVAADAAGFRAVYDLAPADALIVATGQVHQVTHLVCNDERWKRRLEPVKRRFGVLYLGDFV